MVRFCRKNVEPSGVSRVMRILMVNDYGLVMGGAERYACDLGEELRRRGHTVRWLTSDSRGGGPLRRACGGEPFFHHDYFARFWGDRLIGVRAVAQTASAFSLVSMRRAISDFRPDLVHVHGYLGRLSPSVLWPLRNRPWVATLHTYKAICPKGTKVLSSGETCVKPPGLSCVRCASPTLALQQGVRSALWKAPRPFVWLCPSLAMYNSLKREQSDWPLCHLPYGVQKPQSVNFSTENRILFAGRLIETKGPLWLLQAFCSVLPKLPSDAELVFAGDGPMRASLEAFVQRSDCRKQVRFVGHLTREQVSSWFQKSRVTVVPSLWPENLSLTILESLGHGVPVIASRLGGNPELVIDDKTGWLVEPNSVEELGAALVLSLTDGSRLQENAQRIARRHDLDQHAQTLLSIYQRAVNAASKR